MFRSRGRSKERDSLLSASSIGILKSSRKPDGVNDRFPLKGGGGVEGATRLG